MAKLFLTGYMGSGKSTLGKVIANQLQYSFIDLDDFIEQECNMTISEIFAQQGEIAFRSIENNALKKLLLKDNIVVACGGGTPCFYNNMDLMKDNGLTVYIKLSADALAERLKSEKSQRPLIAQKTDEELNDFITQQLEKREDFFHQAQYIVKAKNLDVNQLADFIKTEVGLA